jgi:hypothetical protein
MAVIRKEARVDSTIPLTIGMWGRKKRANRLNKIWIQWAIRKRGAKNTPQLPHWE